MVHKLQLGNSEIRQKYCKCFQDLLEEEERASSMTHCFSDEVLFLFPEYLNIQDTSFVWY